AKLCGVEKILGTIEPGKAADLTIVEGKGYFDPDSKVREVWIDGRIYRAPADEPKPGKGDETKPAKPGSPEEGEPKPEKKTPEKKEKKSEPKATEEKSEKSDKKKEELRELLKTRVARAPLEDRGPLATPPAMLIRNTTIWTCGPDGILTNSDILFS